MRRIFILLMISVMMLTACSFDLAKIRSKQLTGLMNEEGTKIRHMSNDIIKCFTENNKQALQDLFCEQVRNRPSFEDEVEKAFEFFECDVYINSNINTSASGGELIESGKRVSWDVRPEIPYIKTIFDADGDPSTPMEDRYYGVNYYWQIVREDDKSLEGLHYIAIELLNSDSIIIGEKIG